MEAHIGVISTKVQPMNNKSLENLIREELTRARAAKAEPVDNMVLSLAKQVADAVEA